MNQTVYIKCEKSRQVSHQNIVIGDIAKVFCADKSLTARVKALTVVKLKEDKHKRYVVSILKLVELIIKECPGVEVENEGENDIVIEYIKNGKQNNKIMDFIKTAFVCLIVLFGGGFAIMSYNNDTNSNELFTNIYDMVLGPGVEGHMILEIAYSVGLAIGIIVFYGHLGDWKIGKDPTPIEVEMRGYEDEINTAIIKQSEREAVEIDVD